MKKGCLAGKLLKKELSLDLDLNNHVCSDHFISGSPATLLDSTNPDWVPSLRLGYEGDSSTAARQVGQASARHSRTISRSRKRTIAEVDNTPDPELADVDDETPENESGTQTDLTMADIDEASIRHHVEVKQLQEQIEALKESNEQLIQTVKELKQKVDDSLIDEAGFKDKDEKVLYCTGLSS